MIVSPFTPLFFLNDHKPDGIDSNYMQTFATTDRILLEIIDTEKGKPSVTVNDLCAGEVLYAPELKQWEINGSMVLSFITMSFSPGIYNVEIEGYGTSEPFMVTDDRSILDNTTLIQYSMKNNRQRRDTVFFIDGMQYFFDFRVPGGFKDQGWSFGVESEQFVTQYADISQLYGLESTQKKFTLGGSQGVPVWFGEMLNRILVCTHVYFDGVKYSRKDTSVPELNTQLEGVNSFVFTQNLQRSVHLDPVIETRNHKIIRRVSGVTGKEYRKANTNIRKVY